MNQLKWKKAFAVMLCGVAILFAFSGCVTTDSTEEDTQAANTAYMSNVNQIMVDLGDKLDTFNDAVSRGDLVSMLTLMDTAFDELDDLIALDVPEGLEGIQESYVSGITALEEALGEYVELYSEVQEDSFDWSTYGDRLAEIQALYSAGIALLEAGDVLASEMT